MHGKVLQNKLTTKITNNKLYFMFEVKDPCEQLSKDREIFLSKVCLRTG